MPSRNQQLLINRLGLFAGTGKSATVSDWLEAAAAVTTPSVLRRATRRITQRRIIRKKERCQKLLVK